MSNNTTQQQELVDRELKIKEHVKNWERLSQEGYASPLKIRQSGVKGLGVFADKDYKKGEILDYCHCIVLDWKGKYHGDSEIKRYAYWDNCGCRDCLTHGKKGAILLGTGSIVNSSDTFENANVYMQHLFKFKLVVVEASKDIKAGEELEAWHGEDYYNNWCKPRHSTSPTADQS